MTETAASAYDRLEEMTSASDTDWGLGIRARSCALLSEGETAERLYRESIARLGKTRLRVDLARAHLLYGEWLRRDRRRQRGTRATAHRPRHAGSDGRSSVCRTGQERTAGHRRDRPQAHRCRQA